MYMYQHNQTDPFMYISILVEEGERVNKMVTLGISGAQRKKERSWM